MSLEFDAPRPIQLSQHRDQLANVLWAMFLSTNKSEYHDQAMTKRQRVLNLILDQYRRASILVVLSCPVLIPMGKIEQAADGLEEAFRLLADLLEVQILPFSWRIPILYPAAGAHTLKYALSEHGQGKLGEANTHLDTAIQHLTEIKQNQHAQPLM